jgi:endonuclease/exonuclease/phosphatase (EEP) superfamily protein YafD
MNAGPQSETIARAAERLASAYHRLHRTDPVTFPTPLRAHDYPPGLALSIDYIFFDADRFTPTAARIIANMASAEDATLYPSDHYGLAATFTLLPTP